MTDSRAMTDVAAEQRELQRRLGRCLLRLQQYEHLLKRVLPHKHIEGRPDELPAERDRRAATRATWTLGSSEHERLSMIATSDDLSSVERTDDDAPSEGFMRLRHMRIVSPVSLDRIHGDSAKRHERDVLCDDLADRLALQQRGLALAIAAIELRAGAALVSSRRD